MAKAEIKVTLEKTLHEGMKNFALKIWKDHQIKINDISINWLDVSTATASNMIIESININSSTKG